MAGLETRIMIGLLCSSTSGCPMRGCERWNHDPYFQFTGREFLQHTFPRERSDLSHWRKRLGTSWGYCSPRACG